MPAHDRVRPNHARQAEQAWPEPCHPDHECSISSAQPETLRSLPHRDIELMAQIQVLDLKPAPRLEPVEGKNKEQVKHGKHRIEDAPIPSHIAKPARTEFSGRTGVTRHPQPSGVLC
jgi:hypothetical protein